MLRVSPKLHPTTSKIKLCAASCSLLENLSPKYRHRTVRAAHTQCRAPLVRGWDQRRFSPKSALPVTELNGYPSPSLSLMINSDKSSHLQRAGDHTRMAPCTKDQVFVQRAISLATLAPALADATSEIGRFVSNLTERVVSP